MGHWTRIRSCLLATGATLALTMQAGAADFDVLIQGGRVVDGTGNPWLYEDVGIREGKVAAVGNLAGKTATQTIDAKGLVVAPGFIDVHTHADDGLYDSPEAENFVRDGVTTIVTGNCGGSERDLGKYFARLEKDGVGLNVASLYGHNTVLRAVKGDRAGELTPEQWTKGKALVDKAMRDGAVGFSTGLIYTPGTFSGTEEIIEFAKISGQYGGIYATHMRSEAGGIVDAINEALRIGREGNCRVEISHMKLPTDAAARLGGADSILNMVREARRSGQEVWVDQYPYTASSTSLSTMLPDWVLEDRGKTKDILSDPAQLPKILEDMRQNHEIARKRTSLEYAVVANSRAYPEFAGLNIKRVAQVLKLREQKGKDVRWMEVPVSELPEVSMEDQYKAVIAINLDGGGGGVFHTMAETEVETIMKADFVSICSDSGVRTFGVGVPHPRGYGSNARVLGKYTRERGVLRLEDAVRKMTSLPALAFRLEDRGLIRPGYWADMVVFDEAKVDDEATYDDPHHYSVGFTQVLVNGVPIISGGTMTKALPGKVLRGPGFVPGAEVPPVELPETGS